MYRKWWPYLVLLMLGSCTVTSTKKFDTNIQLGANDEHGIVVIGLDNNLRLRAVTGDRSSGQFRYGPQRISSASYHQIAFYITLHLSTKHKSTYAITDIFRDSWTSADLGPCDGGLTVSFDVKPGKVIYLGDLKFEGTGKNAKVSATANFANAQKMVDATFPNLRNRLEESKIEIIPVAALPCSIKQNTANSSGASNNSSRSRSSSWRRIFDD